MNVGTAKGDGELTPHELREFLAESRARLLAIVSQITPDRLAQRPSPERWSPLEVVEHLAVTEEWFRQIVSGLIEEGRRGGLYHQEGGPRSIDAIPALAAQIDLQKPMVAAEFAQPTGALPLDGLLERLERSRQGLLDLCPALDELDTDRLRFRHPFQPFELNAYQWVHLSGLHDRTHTRQIRKALSSNT